MSEKIIIEKKEFIEHVKRICRSNIQKGIKICRVCPLRGYAIEIMKENGWKLPEEERCHITR